MGTLKDKVKELEKEEIINALRDCNWVMARAAKQLGITERMIGYKIKKYGIQKEGGGERPGLYIRDCGGLEMMTVSSAAGRWKKMKTEGESDD